MNLINVPLSSIEPDPANARAVMDVADLVTSIPIVGLLQPLVVRDVDPEEVPAAADRPLYRVIAGHRRLEAMRQLYGGKDADHPVPVVSVPIDNERWPAEIAAIENAHRRNLDAFETADAIARMALAKMKPSEISRVIGQPKAWVMQQAQLVRVIPEMREHVRADRVSMDLAPVLALLPAARQTELLGLAAEGQLSHWTLARQDVVLARGDEIKRLRKLGVPMSLDLFGDRAVVTDIRALQTALIADWKERRSWGDRPLAIVANADATHPEKGERRANDPSRAHRADGWFADNRLEVCTYERRQTKAQQRAEARGGPVVPTTDIQNGNCGPTVPTTDIQIGDLPGITPHMVDAAHVGAIAQELSTNSMPAWQAAALLCGLLASIETRGGRHSPDTWWYLIGVGAPTTHGRRLAQIVRDMIKIMAESDKSIESAGDLDYLVMTARTKFRLYAHDTISRIADALTEDLIFGAGFVAIHTMITMPVGAAQSYAQQAQVSFRQHSSTAAGTMLDKLTTDQLAAFLKSHKVVHPSNHPKKAELLALAYAGSFPPPAFMDFPARQKWLDEEPEHMKPIETTAAELIGESTPA